MALDAASPFLQHQRPVAVFARTDNFDGFLIVWLASFLIVLFGSFFIMPFGWDLDPDQPGDWAVCATVGVLACPLYGARWLRFTPERLIVIRPWLVRRVSWDHVGYCTFEVDDPSSSPTNTSLDPRTGRYLVLWTRRPGRQEGRMLKLLRADPRKLLRADPPASPPPAPASGAATRSERRLSAVLSELHRRGVRLDPFELLSIAMDESEGDEDGAAPVAGEFEDDQDAWDAR